MTPWQALKKKLEEQEKEQEQVVQPEGKTAWQKYKERRASMGLPEIPRLEKTPEKKADGVVPLQIVQSALLKEYERNRPQLTAPFDVKKDSETKRLTKLYQDYNSDGSMTALTEAMKQGESRIRELEKAIEDDRYILEGWTGGSTEWLSEEGKAEAKIIGDRIAENERLLEEEKKLAEDNKSKYDSFWGITYARANEALPRDKKGREGIAEKLPESLSGVYEALRYQDNGDKEWKPELSKRDSEWVIRGTEYSLSRISNMTKDERELFYFLCNNGETDRAELLLKEISPNLSQRSADKFAEKTDVPVLREALAFVGGLGKGLQNIEDGVKSLVMNVEPREKGMGDYAQEYWQQKHQGTLAGYTTGAASSIGNMVPMIAVGAATGGTGAAMTTFLNSRGSAYMEAKENGATHGQAWWKGTLTGLAEAGLQSLLGRAGGMVEGVVPGTVKKWLGGLEGKLASKWWSRLAMEWTVDVSSELIEEESQAFLEPLFDMITGISDTYKLPTKQELWETAIVTAMSSTVFFGLDQTGKMKNQKAYDKEIKDAAEKWAEMGEDTPFYKAAKALQEHFENNKHISPEQVQEILAAQALSGATVSEAPVGSAGSGQEMTEGVEDQSGGESFYEDPDWEKYEQDHSAERFQYDPSLEQVDQLEDMQGWREDTYEQAQGFTDQELEQAIAEKQAIRDDESQDNKSRAIAQHHLDALELVQEQRQNNNASLAEKRTVGGIVNGNAESLNDSGKRYEGLGADGQAGSLAEGAGRSVTRGKGKTKTAILKDLRANASPQSAREIGIIGGSVEQDLYVIPDERVQESEQWSRIKAAAEANGHSVVFVAGTMRGTNKDTGKSWSAERSVGGTDMNTGKGWSAEGIRQVDESGRVTFFIRVDKIGRSAEQIYKHEVFHDIVAGNKELLGDLVLSLEMEYGKQEILRLINYYIEAFEGIYGRFEDNMTEEQEYDLIMAYMEEVFADVYADIQRGTFATDTAQKIMKDQTETVQRGTQNRRAVERKTAPLGQRFSLSPTKRQNLGKEIYRLGTKRIGLLAGNKKIVVLTDDFTKNKAIYSQKGRTKREVNARIKAIPDFESIIRSSRYEDTDTKIRNLESKAKKGVIAIHHFVTKYEGFDIDIVIRDKGNVQFLYEVKFIEHKKSPKQSMTDKLASTAPDGDVWDDDILTDDLPSVKQNFSVDDEAYLSAVEDGDMETAQRMVEEAAKKAGYTIRAYHGTPNGTFHEFKPWQYFTESKEYADRYRNQGASSISVKKTANNPKTYGVFLKTEQPFDTRNAEEKEIFYREFYRQWGNGAPLSDRGLPDWTDGEDFAEFFEENDYSYDSVYLDEGGTGGYGDEVVDRGISIIIKSSEQVKSADPVTYDDDGNLIPLSERFNEGEKDIRFSFDDDVEELDGEYARKMAEEPRRGKSEPEWEAVRESMDDYNADAKEAKIQRAEKQSITALKNRITKNEQMLRELSNMRTMAKKSNFLSMNMDKEIERRREIIQETLEIDRAVLKNKEDAKKEETRTRKQKKQEEEIRKVKAQKATEDMVTEVMDLFFTKKSERYDVREMLYELADQTVKDGRITDEIRDKLLRVLYENSEVIVEPDGSIGDIRKFVQYVKIYVPEDVRTAFGEHWEGFRNKAFGNRIYLTANSNDTSISSVVESLNEVFGYAISDEVTPKTQLEGILDLAEEGKAEKISLPEMMERNREDGWSVEDQMDEMERRLDRILQTFSEKADFEIDLKQKTLRKLNKQREEFRRTLERQRDRAMENELMNQVRKRAQRLKAYYKRATPSARRMIDEQIGDLDTLARSISQKGLEDIQQIIDSYHQTAAELGAAFIANPEIVARLERVKQRHLGDMTVEEVRTLGEALTGIIQQIQNYNKMASEERHLFITDMASQAQREIVESEGTKKTGYLQKFMMGQLNAKSFFGKISGYVDGAWKRLSDKVEHGAEMERQYKQGAMALFDAFLSDKKNQEWLKKASGKDAVWEMVNVKGALTLENGAAVGSVDSVELTPMMKVSILMHSKNDDNLRHIGYYERSGDVHALMGGGATIPDKKLYKKGDLEEAYARGQVIVIPPDTMRAIAKNCTEQEKAFAALLTKYFDGMAKSAINEVSLQVDGWERAAVKNYFPIQSDKAFIVSENELLVQDMSLRGSPFLTERSHKGKNPMFLFDATDVLYRNIDQVARYYGLTRPLRDLHAVMNATYYQIDKKDSNTTAENELLRKVKEQEGWGKVSVGSVEKALTSKWGYEAKVYIERLSAHLQGAKSEGNVLDDFLTGLRGRYARSVISFNPSSVAKQISSYFVAFTYLDGRDLVRGVVTKNYFSNAKEAVMNLSKYSAVYWYRNQGNVNAEIREYTERKGTLERLPLGFQWTQMMDSAVTRRLLAACMHHVSKEMGLKPGSQESIDAGTDRYWSEVAKLFNKVILDTQSNTSTMERPDIVRGDKNSVAKFITMFRTDPFQQHNLMVPARGKLKAAKKAYKANPSEANKKRLTAARKHMAKTTAAIFMGQLTVGLITSLLAYITYRDKDWYDEKGEFSWAKFFVDIALNTAEGYAGMILGLDWIYSLVESAITEEKWYGPEVLGLESVKAFGEDVAAFFSAAVALDFREGKKQLRTLAKSAGFVFGVPVSNIEKYLLMVTRWVAPEFAERWENVWDETEESDLKYRSPRVMEEAISVILDNRVDNLCDEDKAEIARLYIAGGVGAVPGAIPTSFSYTNEEGEEIKVDLSPKQKEKYREVWNKYATSGLADILASEQYESAEDEDKTAYIDKLYKFAGQMAKSAVEPKKEPEKWVQQGLDAQKNGVSLGEYVIFRVDLTEVHGKNEEGETVDGLQMQRSMELVEAMGWTDKQEKAIWMDVVASDSSAAIAEALTKAGMTWDQVNDIVVMKGNKLEKMAAIAETRQSDAVKVKAMCVFANEKEKKLLTVGLRYGIKPEWYMEVLKNANADGKGTITQAEAKEYIDAMDLSWQEKTALYQMVTDEKVTKNYPFYQSYAENFWYEVHEDDPE